MRRKCRNPKCENPAANDTGMGARARLCAECYGRRVVMQARTQRMDKCQCGNVLGLGKKLCGRCARTIE